MKCLKRRQYACEILFFYMFFHYQKPQQADSQKVRLLRSAKAEKFCVFCPHRPTEIKQLPDEIKAEYVTRHHKTTQSKGRIRGLARHLDDDELNINALSNLFEWALPKQGENNSIGNYQCCCLERSLSRRDTFQYIFARLFHITHE